MKAVVVNEPCTYGLLKRLLVYPAWISVCRESRPWPRRIWSIMGELKMIRRGRPRPDRFSWGTLIANRSRLYLIGSVGNHHRVRARPQPQPQEDAALRHSSRPHPSCQNSGHPCAVITVDLLPQRWLGGTMLSAGAREVQATPMMRISARLTRPRTTSEAVIAAVTRIPA